MKSSTRHAMLLAKRPLFRKIYFWSLGIIMTYVGLGIAYVAITEYRKTREALALPAIIIGPLLPIIIVGGEKYRLKRGAKDIRCVRCIGCNSEFSLEAMYKTGRCPDCGSKRVAGITFDGSTIFKSH